MHFRNVAVMGLAGLLVMAVAACTRRDDAASSGAGDASPATTEHAPAGTTVDGTLEVGGRTRTYHVHYPTKVPDGPASLVIGLHGGLGSGRQFEENTGFDAVADSNGFIVVYPDGIGGVMGDQDLRTWNAGNCCGPARQQNVDDVGFISALIDHLSSTMAIDEDRVYAVGHSNGGIMAYRLA